MIKFILSILFFQTFYASEILSEETKSIIENKTESEEKYSSKLVGNLSSDYLKNLQLTPAHQKSLRENKDLWFAEKYRAGFAIRPRLDSLSNFDFDKSTADDSISGSNQTQFYLLADISKNVLFKVTLQDLRIWGGEVFSNSNQEQKYAAITNAGTIVDTTKEKNLPLNNHTGIREAFVDLKTAGEMFRFRVGRQNIDFGDGRILGSRIDTQQGNTFDGLRLTTKYDIHTFDLFGTILSTATNSNGLVSSGSPKVGGSGDIYFGGGHYNIKLFDYIGIDIYNFTLYKKGSIVKNPPDYATETKYRGDDQMNTSGFRLTNRIDKNNLPVHLNWDWMIEAAWQTGYNGTRVTKDWLNPTGQYATDQNTGTSSPFSESGVYKSHFFAIQTGYSFKREFRIGIQYTYASGDPNRNDASVGTFNPLFASRRMASGINPFQGNGNSGAIFWQNVKDYSIYIKYDTLNYGTFIFNPHVYDKVKLQDGYYDNNNYITGNQKTGGLASTEDYYNNQQNVLNKPSLGKRLATELNFVYIITPFENVSFWLSYSHLFAGDAIRNQKNNVWNSDPLHRYDFKREASYLSFQLVFAI